MVEKWSSRSGTRWITRNQSNFDVGLNESEMDQVGPSVCVTPGHVHYINTLQEDERVHPLFRENQQEKR